MTPASGTPFTRSSSSLSIFLIILLLFLLISFLFQCLSASAHSLALRDFSREDIALLYQRLKTVDDDRTARQHWTGESRPTTTTTVRSRYRPRNRQQQQQQRQKQHNDSNPTPTSLEGQGKRRKMAAVVSAQLTMPPATSIVVAPTTTAVDRIVVSTTSVTMQRATKSDQQQQRVVFVATPPQHSSPSLGRILWVVIIVMIGVFFSAATSIGNALVMISICVDKKLQTISNYFLFSLAVADLTIGIISIPLMTLYTAAQSWNFGYTLCQFWLCIDYLMCNASVLNLLLISFDRYFSVTRPLTYRPKRTTRKALFMIAGSYLLSLLLWPPWIVLWPYLEGRFIVEESALCVVQFLALGTIGSRNWLNQLVTVGTAAAAFYIPVTLMIVLYYKVYLETQKRQKELKKLQDGQIRGLHSAAGDPLPPPTLRQTSLAHFTASPSAINMAKSTSTQKAGLNFLELVNTIPSMSPQPAYRKKERFSLLKFCTGRAQTDISSEGSMVDECGVIEDTSCGGGVTTSNLDSILADSTLIELANNIQMDDEEEAEDEEGEETNKEGQKANLMPDSLELNRTSRPSSVHTYNSIVIIEYPNGRGDQTQRPSVRLSSHAEVASLSARNSVEKRNHAQKEEPKGRRITRRRPSSEERKPRKEEVAGKEALAIRRNRLSKTKSCPATEGEGGKQQQNGTTPMRGAGKQLMRKSDIMLLREENMRRSEKERRRNERKQEGKAAKTLSAILFAFIITWTPYNVIVCLEAFFPNSVPAYLFTLSYFLSYINSTINPLCYALCNARFRMTYLRIIRCKWRNPSLQRQPFAESSFGRTSSGKRVLLKRHSRAKIGHHQTQTADRKNNRSEQKV